MSDDPFSDTPSYYWSPSKLGFFAGVLRETYETAGTWPSDAVIISDDTWHTYIQTPPDGFILGNVDNQPAWVAKLPPTLQEQAAFKLRKAIFAITCAAHPELDGSYSVSDSARTNIIGIVTSIANGLGLPGGGDTFNYPDIENQAHPWPAVQFMNFARGAMNYIYQLSQVAGGHGDELPTEPTAIE